MLSLTKPKNSELFKAKIIIFAYLLQFSAQENFANRYSLSLLI